VQKLVTVPEVEDHVIVPDLVNQRARTHMNDAMAGPVGTL
jgi:hypothetical protein